MKKAVLYFLLVLLLAGCSTASKKVALLEQQNLSLSTDLQATRDTVARLEKENAGLSTELEKQVSITETLGKEKAVRIKESGTLRQDTRTFLKAQISALREFSQKSDFLDYIGGELINREKSEEQGLTLVDMKNNIHSSGSLLGTWGYFTSPCSYVVNILRKANDEWLVVWQAGPFTVEGTGIQRFGFDIPVSVEQGDMVAYTFQGAVGVPHSSGTGDTLYTDKRFKVGGKVPAPDLYGKSEKRTYSIGVVGILQ